MPSLLSRLYSCRIALLAGIAICHQAHGFTKSGNAYTTTGALSDVAAAVANAANGDVINIPAGSFTWGTAGAFVNINKTITLAGAGPGVTVINLDSTGPTFSNAVIRLTAAATVKDFTVNGTTTVVTAFSGTTSNNWRITNITYNGASSAYFCYTGSYGLIDNCVLNGGSGSQELVFGRGPTNSWQTPSSMGTGNAVYIENCTFNGVGYVCDANSNARFVVRFCTITGPIKVDGHGSASNTPFRGVRQMEIYNNTWTSAATFWNAMEVRGGTGMIFDNLNTNTASPQHGRIRLTDYGYTSQWTNFGGVYQTPTNYPVKDQIGVGMDPKIPASEPMYLWNNLRGAADWVTSVAAIPTAAIDLYRTQIGNPSATYTMNELITADREYFKQTVGSTFNGSSGVGRGTKAQMLAISPTKTGVGFWVTDEAEWNSSNGSVDGQFYTWNGSSWGLKYTPYTYPHPLRGTPTTPPPPPPPPPVLAPSNAKVQINVQ